jgi:surfactin synthase thioesterase subunit
MLRQQLLQKELPHQARHKNSCKIRIQKEISNLRKELSILTDSDSGSDKVKLNIRKRKICQKYKITNAKEIAELIEKLNQKVQAKAFPGTHTYITKTFNSVAEEPRQMPE